MAEPVIINGKVKIPGRGRLTDLYTVRVRRQKEESRQRAWERALVEEAHRLDPVTRKLRGPRWKKLEIALQARNPIPVDPEMIQLLARTAR